MAVSSLRLPGVPCIAHAAPWQVSEMPMFALLLLPPPYPAEPAPGDVLHECTQCSRASSPRRKRGKGALRAGPPGVHSCERLGSGTREGSHRYMDVDEK